MNESYQTFIELANKIKAYFINAIAQVKENPSNHNQLDGQFSSIKTDNLSDALLLNSSEGLGFGRVNLEKYSHALMEALKNNPLKTDEILQAHRKILDEIKNFSEIKLKFIESNDYRILPFTEIRCLDNTGFFGEPFNLYYFGFGQGADKEKLAINDYYTLLKITITIDKLNKQLDTYCHTISKKNLFSAVTKKKYIASSLQNFLNTQKNIIQYPDVNLENFSAEEKQKYHNAHQVLKEKISKQLKKESKDLKSLYNKNGESNLLMSRLSSFLSMEHSLKLQLYLLLQNHQNFTSPWNIDPGQDSLHRLYLKKIRGLCELIKLSSHVTIDKKKYTNDYKPYHHLERNSRVKILNDHLNQLLQKDIDFLRRIEAFRIDQPSDAPGLTNFLKSNPQTKHFLEKLLTSLKTGRRYSFENKDQFIFCHGIEKTIAGLSKIIHPVKNNTHAQNADENAVDKEIDAIIEYYASKHNSLEMQYKRFDLVYIKRALDWRDEILDGQHSDYDKADSVKSNNEHLEYSSYLRNEIIYYQTRESYCNDFTQYYKSVIEKLGRAFGFDPTPYIEERIYQHRIQVKNSEYYKSYVEENKHIFTFEEVPDINTILAKESTLPKLDFTQARVVGLFTFFFDYFQSFSGYDIDSLGNILPNDYICCFIALYKNIDENLTEEVIDAIHESYIAKKKFYEAELNEQESDTDIEAQNDSNTTQNSIEASEDYDIHTYKTVPITPEDKLAEHNQNKLEEYQQQSEALRQKYAFQKIYVSLFEQLYLNQQVHAQQNVQNNIIQLQPRIHRQLAATGTDGFAVSSHVGRSHNHIAPIRQLPSAQNNTKASPPIARVRNFVHPTGIMMGGMYISRVIAYKATHNAKFADRLSELSAYPIASSLLYYYANNVGVAGGFAATSRATLYYAATKAPPVAAATAVATIIATPFIQLKKYADMANYSANKQKETIINSVLFQAKQDPDYFAQTFYSHDEKDDLFKERYGVISLNKTKLQISRDHAFMDYELADTALSTITSMLDAKQDEALNKKKTVFLQIRSNALNFLKSTYPTPRSSNISFGAFDHFK